LSTPTLPLDTSISVLIDGEYKWNETLIKQHFTAEDIEHILKIVLPKSLRPNKLIWGFDKHGNYTVKRGY